MKLLIWSLTGFLALLWTGAAALVSGGLNWLATASLDPAFRSAEAMAQLPLAPWLSAWLPSELLAVMQPATVEFLAFLGATTSWLLPWIGWLSPLVWLVWAVVLSVLVAAAVGAHWWTANRRGGSRLAIR